MSLKVLIVLVALTSVTFLFGLFDVISDFVIAILLLSVFIKGYLISEHFMELRQVVVTYRVIPILWLLIVLSFIVYGYYFPL